MWLRLDAKRACRAMLELDLVLASDRPDQEVGLWLRDLVDQLRPGDRLHVALHLVDGPADGKAP